MAQAIIWDHRSYSTEDQLENLARFKMVLNEDALEIYKRLHQIDLTEYQSLSESLPDQSALPHTATNDTSALRIQDEEKLRDFIATQIDALRDEIKLEMSSLSSSLNAKFEELKKLMVLPAKDTGKKNITVMDKEFIGMGSSTFSIPDFIDDNDEEHPSGSITYEMFLEDIFSTFRYRQFESEQVIRASVELAQYFDRASATGAISKIDDGFYRCSIEGADGQYIDANYIYSSVLKRSNDTSSNSLISASGSRHFFNSNIRPSASRWVQYLDDLALDGVLEVASKGKIVCGFKLKN